MLLLFTRSCCTNNKLQVQCCVSVRWLCAYVCAYECIKHCETLFDLMVCASNMVEWENNCFIVQILPMKGGKWKCEGRGEWFVEPGHVVSEELAGFVFCCWRVTYIIQEGQQDIDDYQRFLIVWKITLFLFWKSQNSFPFLSVVCQDSYCTFFLTKRENIITDPDANPRQCFYNHTFLLKSFLPLSFVIFS